MRIKKAIFIDLDGTLLNERNTLTEKSKSIMKRLNEAGFMVVFSSGRPWRSMEEMYKECGCYGPVIAYNGVSVFVPNDPSFKAQHYRFPQIIVKDLFAKMGDKAKSMMCETESTVYITHEDPYLDNFFWYDGMRIKKGDMGKILDESPMTCIFKCAIEDRKFVEPLFSDLFPIQLRHWTGEPYSELYFEGADKGHAVTYIRSQLGIAKEDTIGLGDADNDLGMLQACGSAVCMKDCKSSKLREIFPHTEKGNAEDGAALYLEELLLD